MSNVINKGLNLMNTAYNSAGGIVLSGDAVKGGYFVTDTLDNIPSWTHVAGTLCYCTEDSKFYQYSGSEWKKVLFVTLGDDGKIPQSLLPDYFDDVLDFTNYSAFPLNGEVGKIYIDKDTNVTYRWNGEKYVKIGSTLELGETETTAYAGSKGKKNAEDIVNIQKALEKKVEIVEGKGLSDANFTNAEKEKLENLYNYDDAGILENISKKVDKTTTVNGHTLSENITITKSDVGLGDVLNVPSYSKTETDDLFEKISNLKALAYKDSLTKGDIGLANVENVSSYAKSETYSKREIDELLSSKGTDVIATGDAGSIQCAASIKNYKAIMVRGYIAEKINKRCFSVILDPEVLSDTGYITTTHGNDESGLYGAIFNIEFAYSADNWLYTKRAIMHWVHETGPGTFVTAKIQKIVGIK